MTTNDPSGGRNELENYLMGKADRVFRDATLQNLCCDGLLFRKSTVETVDENIRVNESGHVYKDPLAAILFLELASDVPPSSAAVFVPLPGQTAATVILCRQVRHAYQEE
jgi:hypothetical protein